jgi:glutathione synthase/RimK-type ligase-like ATP-grasp enzyme
MQSIAFVTYRKLNGIAPDDLPAAEALRRRGLRVEGVVWDDPSAEWTKYDTIVIRSCWDYFYHPAKFAEWINQLEALKVRVLNPLSIVRWNHDKKYLRDLEQRGITIAPTFWCERSRSPKIGEILRARNWQKAVVKPTISGTSLHTWVVEQGDHAGHDEQLAELLTQRDMMIQEYMPEIEGGEWSVVFFGRDFSHAAVKRPKPGDFRVQDEHGGTWAHEQPSEELKAQARHVLNCINEDLLYARVDGIVRDGQFILMELEIIEPMLYFGANTTAAEMFAEKLIERL